MLLLGLPTLDDIGQAIDQLERTLAEADSSDSLINFDLDLLDELRRCEKSLEAGKGHTPTPTWDKVRTALVGIQDDNAKPPTE